MAEITPKPLAPIPLGGKDLFKHFKSIYETFMRNMASDLPALLDYPGMGIAGGVLGMTKRAGRFAAKPSRILDLFRRFGGTESPTDSAISFGYAFRKNPQMRETLEEAKRMAYKAYDKAPKGSQARQDHAFIGQLLREASEEAVGKTPKGFSFLEQQAKRRVSAKQRELYESGVHFLPEAGGVR